MTLSFGPGPRSVRLTKQMHDAERAARANERWCCEGVAGGAPCTPDCVCEGEMLRHFQADYSGRSGGPDAR